MSNSQQTFKAGQARGAGHEQANQAMGSLRDKTSSAAQHAEEHREHAAGFLQQTGEQVKEIAHGAVDAVKSTLGVGDNNNNNGSHQHKK